VVVRHGFPRRFAPAPPRLAISRCTRQRRTCRAARPGAFHIRRTRTPGSCARAPCRPAPAAAYPRSGGDAHRRNCSLRSVRDFLGFNARRYGDTPLIKPSKAGVRRIGQRVRAELRSLRWTNPGGDQPAQPPGHPGMAAYRRAQVSAKAFGKLDDDLWRLTACFRLSFSTILPYGLLVGPPLSRVYPAGRPSS
jgi:hypothetical protein